MALSSIGRASDSDSEGSRFDPLRASQLVTEIQKLSEQISLINEQLNTLSEESRYLSKKATFACELAEPKRRNFSVPGCLDKYSPGYSTKQSNIASRYDDLLEIQGSLFEKRDSLLEEYQELCSRK